MRSGKALEGREEVATWLLTIVPTMAATCLCRKLSPF